MASEVYLSVVVPVRNEEKHIRQTLDAIAGQDYPQDRYEIIVVDGRSADKTREVVEDFMRRHEGLAICLLDNPCVLSSSGRNIGIRAARGRVMAVIDGHVHIPDTGLFAAIERIKETHGALCLARPAPLLVPTIENGMPFWIATARKCWLAHSQNSYIYSDYEGLVDPVSSGFAYDRCLFDQVGYFDESFDAAEDVEFHHRLKRAGIQAYTSPKLTIYSYPRETLSSLFRQMVRYGVGRARCLRKHPDAYTKEQLVPPVCFLLFAFLPLSLTAGLWVPLFSATYATVFLLYAMVLMISGIITASRHRRILPGALVACAIWTIHMGLGYGFVKTVLSPRHRPMLVTPEC